MPAFSWLGDDQPYLNTVNVQACDHMLLGMYGGNITNGADKNEDGALLAYDLTHNWELAMVADAHYSADSARLLVRTIDQAMPAIEAMLAQPLSEALQQLHQFLLDLLLSETFLEQCRHVRGETSCLIVVRKSDVVWWFAVGDCVGYMLHPALTRLGEYALNQRRFYEWIGRNNTFAYAVPCYTTGTRRLINGLNTFVLLTDGVLECGDEPFANAETLYRTLLWDNGLPQSGLKAVLERVQRERGRDSATMIVWQYDTVQNIEHRA